MKMNREELFNQLISLSVENLKLIVDPKDEIIAMTEIAKALALSGLISHGEVTIDKSKLNSIEKNVKTDEDVKEESKKIEERIDEPIQEGETVESDEEEIEEEEIEEEEEELPEPEIIEGDDPIPAQEDEVRQWTAEYVEKYKDEVIELKKKTEEIGKENISKLVSDFSQGFLKNGLQDILPNNIEAFLAYLKSVK